MPLENDSPKGTLTAAIVVTLPSEHTYRAIEHGETTSKQIVIYQEECTYEQGKKLAESIKKRNSTLTVKTTWTGQTEI